MEADNKSTEAMESAMVPLSETLLACKKETRFGIDDIGDILEVSQHLMSFGQFISSKILGSHLTLTNKSDKD